MGIATQQWQVVDELFKSALDCSPSEREAFVENAANYPESIKLEVQALLKAVEGPTVLNTESGAFSGKLWDEFAHEITNVVDRNPIEPGTMVGEYRVVREVGRGGMAVVFEAEREYGPLTQRYALKLIKRGTDTDEVVRRFGFERQILASLNHPNIARLFDGGVSDDGRPFFVMEFVAGRTITQYAREEKLSVEQRLRLFLNAMDAVQYAHRNLVVHRDLKPSNILVTADGVPKLLDFGIAKVVSDDNSETVGVRTQTGSFWLTPDYASPEQVKGETVTTSSDVYGLGVVLYELLTGQRPFVVDHADPLELRRMICDDMPEKPSVVVARLASSKTQNSAKPDDVRDDAITSDRVARRLRGDIDVIIRKALRKEPERRYFSTEAMAADIRRYLDGRPLRARPDSLQYRTSKYFVRNAKILVMGITVLVLAFGSIIFHTSRVTKQRNIAQSEAEKSAQVAAFMSGLLGAFGPNQSERGTVQVDELLRQGIQSIEADPTIRPEVQAEVYVNIGDLYEDYAEYDRAIDILKRARRLQDEVYDPLHPSVSSTMALLGWTMHKNGVGAPAVEMLEDALGRQRQAGNQAGAAQTLNRLGIIYMERDELELALRSFQEAMTILQAKPSPQDQPLMAETLGNLGYIYQRMDDPDRAEDSFRRAMAIAKTIYVEHSDLAAALQGYGSFLVASGQPREGVKYLEEALAMRLKIFGENHPQVANSRSNLGLVYQDLERYEESLEQQQKALKTNRDTFGGDHVTVAHSLHSIGWVYYWMKDYDSAERHLVEAARLYAKVYHPRHSYVAVADNKIGLIRMEQKNFAGAETAFMQSLSIRDELNGPDYHYTLIARTNLANMYLEWGKLDTAESVIRDVLARREKSPDRSDFRVGQAKRDLGAILTAKKEYVAAEVALQEGYDLIREARGLEDPYTQTAIRQMIELYSAIGNASKARAFRGLLVENTVAAKPLR